MTYSNCIICGIPILKKKYCSHKCRNIGSSNVLRKFNKNRVGKTYSEIFGEKLSIETRNKQSKSTSVYNKRNGIVPPSRKGIKDSELTRKRKSIGHKGVNTWMKGRKMPEESCRKNSESHKGINTWTKEKFKNKEFREKQHELMLKGLLKRPTSLEKDMIEFIRKHNFPYKYVGDGKFWIDGKNPDFVNINGEKKLIEVGNVFHHQGDYIEKRREHFAKYGWKSFIFIGDKLNEEEILKEL